MTAVLCWFHQDLRLADHPALTAAIATGHPVIPLYVYDQDSAGEWAIGGASRWWLDQSLRAFDADLQTLGSKLVIANGRADAIIADMAAKHQVSAVYCHDHHEPWARDRQKKLQQKLSAANVQFHKCEGVLLWPPGSSLKSVMPSTYSGSTRK